TADTRLSAFGALTPSIRVDKQFDHGWSADVTFSYYQQRSSWRLGGSGTGGLLPVSARWISIGVAKTFRSRLYFGHWISGAAGVFSGGTSAGAASPGEPRL